MPGKTNDNGSLRAKCGARAKKVGQLRAALSEPNGVIARRTAAHTKTACRIEMLGIDAPQQQSVDHRTTDLPPSMDDCPIMLCAHFSDDPLQHRRLEHRLTMEASANEIRLIHYLPSRAKVPDGHATGHCDAKQPEAQSLRDAHFQACPSRGQQLRRFEEQHHRLVGELLPDAPNNSTPAGMR